MPALATGEVSVHTCLSALSVASELGLLRGGPFPARLGYQTLGVVGQVGPACTLTPGQRVVTTLGHASAGIHPQAAVVAVPEEVSDRAALCVILGEETQKGIRKLAPQPGERLLVAGAGLLGLLSVFNLTRRGFGDVTVLEPDPQRRALAARFGAVAVAPGELTRDDYHAGLECSASPAGFAELLSHLRPGGRACVLSDGNWGALTLPAAFHRRELTVLASSDGDDYHAYAQWLWDNTDPVLESLHAQTITAAELPGIYPELMTLPRPVSVLVRWP